MEMPESPNDISYPPALLTACQDTLTRNSHQSARKIARKHKYTDCLSRIYTRMGSITHALQSSLQGHAAALNTPSHFPV